MKKYLIILLTLPLIATSCLKDDEDKFDKSASERMKEFLDKTSKVLSEAPNGWVVEYYPSAAQEYGGVRMYMKFDASKNTVTVASEAGASDATETSYYSFGEDYGPTLNFDTYNSLFHYYSEPQGTVGEANVGWGGDYEFIITSVEADQVLLTGKKTKNRIVLTPAATSDWKSDFEAYRASAAKMDEMLSYQFEVGSRVYQMSRDAVSRYNSRHFTINTTPATTVGYIYTSTGIKFYEPLTIDNVTIAEMEWDNGKFVDQASGCVISQITSNDTFEVTTSDVGVKTATVSVRPSNPNTYYVIGAYPAADAETKSDAAICNEIVSRINSVSNLFVGDASTVMSLKSETEYIACAFAVTIVNDYVYPTSALSKSAPFTTLQDVPMESDYEAWLGTWTVKSTSSEVTNQSLTFDITIEEKDRNQSVYINGWSICMFRWDPELYGIANYTNDGTLEIENEQYLFDVSGYALRWTNRMHYSRGYNTVSGDFITMTLTLGANSTTATSKEAVLELSGGGTCTITGMDYMYFNEAGNYGWYDPAEGFTADDFAVGPYSLTKKSGAANAGKVSVARVSSGVKSRAVMLSDYTSVKLGATK